MKRVTPLDVDAVEALWGAAADQRRDDLGIERIRHIGSAVTRDGAFGAGVWDDDRLVAMAIAMPAKQDDGRSVLNTPGLAHISSVATVPGRWGEGLSGIAVRASMSLARRRGYARVQLWTHATNTRAQRLYQREGFEFTGRAKLDDYGEQIVHLVRELPEAERLRRPAARILCLDPDDRVFLMRWRDPHDGHQLWEPPGGGIEPGEDPADAAVREWAEETGLPAPAIVAGPTDVARDVFWSGRRLVGDEQFYLARVDEAHDIDLAATDFTAGETNQFLEARWVPLGGLAALDDTLTPDLPPVLARLGVDPN